MSRVLVKDGFSTVLSALKGSAKAARAALVTALLSVNAAAERSELEGVNLVGRVFVAVGIFTAQPQKRALAFSQRAVAFEDAGGSLLLPPSYFEPCHSSSNTKPARPLQVENSTSAFQSHRCVTLINQEVRVSASLMLFQSISRGCLEVDPYPPTLPTNNVMINGKTDFVNKNYR